MFEDRYTKKETTERMINKMEITVKPAEKIEGRTRIPGDRDMAHTALVFSSLAEDTIEIEGFTETPDLLSTLHCLKELGVEFAGDGDRLKVKGKGLRGFAEPDNVLDAGSGALRARAVIMRLGHPDKLI